MARFSGKTALGNLRRAITELRVALSESGEHEWIITAHDELRWNRSSPYKLDVEEFKRLIHQATPNSLHTALVLYTDDLLPQMDEDWIVVEREHLRQKKLTTLNHLMSHYKALGEWETAIRLVNELLEIDPLTESTHRNLMALYYLKGDRAAALAAYQRVSDLLRDELDVKPMHQTQMLMLAISEEHHPPNRFIP